MTTTWTAPNRADRGQPTPTAAEDTPDPWQARRARVEAQQAERDHLQQLANEVEQVRVRALPVADVEVDADATVAELEQRVADGDTSVTATQLAKARTDAAGRVRFGRLRGVFADRAARKDAEQLERDQAAAAEQHARDALAAHSPAVLVERYDAAVDALRALTATVDGRNATLLDLVRLPAAERVRGAVFDAAHGGVTGAHVLPLDGAEHRPQLTSEVVTRVIRAAGIVPARSGAGLRVVDEHEHSGGEDPRTIAEARAQLEAPANGDAA